MISCARCGGAIEMSFRYCPWCAAALRAKQAVFLMGAGDDVHRALRISRFEGERQVRVSVWDDTGRAAAALSLDEDEAARLAAFVAPEEDDAPTLS